MVIQSLQHPLVIMDFGLPRGMRQYCAPRSIIFTQSCRFHRCEREPGQVDNLHLHLIEQLKVSASFLMYDDDPNTTCIVSVDGTARK